MKKITLRVDHFSGQPKLGPYLRYEWMFLNKKVRRVYYEKID